MTTQQTVETRIALLEDAFGRMSQTLPSIEGILSDIRQQLATKAIESAAVRAEVRGDIQHIKDEQHTQNERLDSVDVKLAGITEKLDHHILLDSWTRRGVMAAFGGMAWFVVWAWDHITVATK